ncbi:hypothetical protein [Streptomyces sp. NPDC015345]|uniref:hypothetical protein n=1 Tax=Streptomyces sp. NPDC015345 TaxID=3364953 RepID=UPI0036FA9C0F
MRHHREAETARKTAPRPRHARPHRALSAKSPGTATALARLLTSATASADTPGPGVVAPVITRPADGSPTHVGRHNPRIIFAGSGEPGARISLSYGPDRTSMALRGSVRVGGDGTWVATALKDSVPAGTYDMYVSEDAAPGQEDKRTLTFITDRNVSRLQWDVKSTTSRVRAGGTTRLYGWTNSMGPVGDVAVQLTTQGRRFPLGTFATEPYGNGKSSAVFDVSGVPVPVGVPGGMANLVVPVAFPTPEISGVARTKKDVTVTGTTLGDEGGKGRMQVLGADGTWFDQGGYSGSGTFTLHVDPAKLGATFAVRFVDGWTDKATPASPAQHTPAPSQAPTPDSARSPQSAEGSDSTPAPEPTRSAQPTQAPSPAPAQTPSPTPTQATADDKR